MPIRSEGVEEFPRAHLTVFLGGTGEGGAIALQGTFLHAGQHLIAVFSQPPDRLRIMLRVVAGIGGQRSRDVDALLELAVLVTAT